MKRARDTAITAGCQFFGGALFDGKMTNPHRPFMTFEWHVRVGVSDGIALVSPNSDGGGGTAWSLTAATLTLDGDAEPGTGLGLSLAGAVAGYGFEVELPLSVAGGAAR